MMKIREIVKPYPTPTDPMYYSQWNLHGTHGINAPEAWKSTKGSPDIKIAVVDMRIERDHLDLIGQFTDYIYDPPTENNISDDPDHGCKVAGIIGAKHNGLYISGIAPNCKIMPVTMAFGAAVSSYEIAELINKAVQNGADIINCSWRLIRNFYPTVEEALKDALTSGRDGKGTIVCFSSGNEGVVEYPGDCHPDIIVVGAIDKTGSLWENSGVGPEVDVVAPGVDITLLTKYGWTKDRGTSFAAPHVSAIAGLLLSLNPNLTQKEVGTIINDCANNSFHSNGTGWGKVDAAKAIKWLNYKFDEFILPESYPVLQNEEFSISMDLPKSATINWSSSVGNIYWQNGACAHIRYPNQSIITDVITAECVYLGKKFTTSKTVTLYKEPTINGFKKILDGSESRTNLSIMAECADPKASTKWTVIESTGATFNIVDFYYSYDAVFYECANLCSSVEISEWYGEPGFTPSCIIRVDAYNGRTASREVRLDYDFSSQKWILTPLSSYTLRTNKSSKI